MISQLFSGLQNSIYVGEADEVSQWSIAEFG
jgi:hypothetical protein